MSDFFDFYGDRGCFWSFLRIGLLIYAVLCLVSDVYTRSAWLILVGEALDIVVYIIYRRATRKKWNRPDSYWSKKEEPEDSPQDE